jgi:MinD-like ATPase involved in chromosome partitioning or flagellar assembly
VVNSGATAEPAPTVERMLAGPSVRRGDGVSGRVMVVPGGHRPGKPDQLQRDRARAQLPIIGPRRVVVLGCTVGAGQTITALLTGEVLASLRSDSIVALDLNPGPSSLIRRGRLRPALAQVTSAGSPRLAILGPLVGGADPSADETEPDPGDPAASLAHAVGLFKRATAEHQIVLADPSTTVVPRLLSIADQLILVAPASAAAARAIGMTFEWLDAHGHADLAAEAIMVMNGVSRRSSAHVEQAERGCIGRCRAIVRVPWDEQLGLHAAKQEQSTVSGSPAGQWAGAVSPATAGAYTALAGVLVVALADQASPGDEPGGDDNSRSARPANAAASTTRAGSGWGPR